ncbi:MAG: pyruvate dehydrogenase (acetyl-transferring) E1 component subunit alpha [Oligoflexus sp.]
MDDAVAKKKTYLKHMLRVRRFEERCAELYSAGHIRGFLHLYIGEEAVAVGILSSINAEDAVFTTYREHGHALIKGVPARQVMAEMFGKVTGASRGRGGSMHIFDREHRFYGGNAIVAGALPMAVGLALAENWNRQNHIVLCFFGEGAMAEGEFHEAANLASLWKLPILFVCENNLYAMGTALHRSQAQTDLCMKAAAHNISGWTVDGMDVLQVADVAERAIRHVRELREPLFLECKTYRFRAHSMFDPELYRPKEEVELWKQRDPIVQLRDLLGKEGHLNDEEWKSLEEEIREELDDAIAFAESSDWEPVSELMRFVYAETGEGKP